MNTKEIIAKRIKERRLKLKLTQKQLAEIINVQHQTVSKYENGINSPDSQMLNKLSGILDCTTDYLLGKTDNPNNSIYKSDNIVLEIKETPFSYNLTSEEINIMVNYLKATNYNVDKLIKEIKSGKIK